MANEEDITDTRNSVAYSILVELERDGKLTQAKQFLHRADDFKEKFKRLHEIVVQSFDNEKLLLNKARDLRQEVQKQQHKLESVTQRQSETALSLERLNKTLEDVSYMQTQAELDQSETRVQVLEFEISQLEQNRNEALNYLAQREEEQNAKLQPEIQNLQNLIDQGNTDMENINQRILKEEENQRYLEDRVNQLMKEMEELQDNLEANELALNKAKSEPVRYQKNADILIKAIQVMEADYNKAKQDEQAVDRDLAKLHEEHEMLKDQISNTREQIHQNQQDHQRLKGEGQSLEDQIKNQNQVKTNIEQNNEQLATQLEELNISIKRIGESTNQFQKSLYKLKKEYKMTEQHRKQIQTQLADIERQMGEAQERLNALNEERARQNSVMEKLKEEHEIMMKRELDVDEENKMKKSKLEEIMSKIQSNEDEAQRARDEENELSRKMEWLSLQRENMARKASQSIAQARETAEDLKIRELLLIDLRKKHQETEAKLKSYNLKYDEVKNARNKYVKLIQNSSQELAETKERIKILQNEVEILRNESADKDRKLKNEMHNVQQSQHERDNLRAEINKLEYSVKLKQSHMKQQINEIKKLNVIITSLEKEMIELKLKYETVCESRNYTGIQLIDRNDELCILYEKANIQDSIQKKGESEIRNKENEIRMYKLELAEIQRQIEVVRKQIPLVPEFAGKVKILHDELLEENEKVKKLSSQLEDPSNLKRFRELPGEETDEEALEAKIQVLEERLNNKKEQLLEKELVLEEISNLADKLRAQALTGRQSTLELAERVNGFQSRIKTLTRKMMATVSELSMYQATAMKLSEEKDRIELILQQAYDRIDNSLPPTDECEREWERMERHRIMIEEERIARKEREEEERMLPGQVTRTTAEPRHNAYIPDDGGMGVPKSYGAHAQFQPTKLGSTMRHIRKPQPKPIEI